MDNHIYLLDRTVAHLLEKPVLEQHLGVEYKYSNVTSLCEHLSTIDPCRALKYILVVVLGYFVIVNLTVFIVLITYSYAAGVPSNSFIHCAMELQTLSFVESDRSVMPWWASLFHTFSAFNDAGLSPYQANLIPFQSDAVYLITISG